MAQMIWKELLAENGKLTIGLLAVKHWEDMNEFKKSLKVKNAH